MKKSYIITLSVIGLFVLVSGVAFAFFYATNNDSDVDVTGSAKEINAVEYLPGSSMDIPVSGIYPGWIGVMDFTVGKPDGVTAGVGTYEIVLETDIDPAYSDWITYELYKSTDMGKSISRVEGTLSDDVFNLYVDDSLTPNGYTIPDDAFIAGVANSTTGDVSVDKQSYDFSTYQNTKYYLVMRFLNENINQNAAINKNFEIKVVMKETVSDSSGDGYKDPVIAGGDPVITESESSSYKMLPVLIADDGTVSVADTSKEWYNYENKEWANAVIVDVTSSETTPGTVLSMDKIEQMYVWIPRFQYDPASIESASHAIDVSFVDKNTEAHPAFTFGTDELSGMWVGKFEQGENNTIKPNQNSIHNMNVSTLYYNINNVMNTYSLDSATDVHMIKNIEWGAVAYLSQSKYGVCSNDGTCSEKVENNNHYNHSDDEFAFDITTGCGGDDVIYGGLCKSTNLWNTSNGKGASTTHNISGIYDMAGGRFEFVMANMQDVNGEFYPHASGFVSAPNSKYYDIYLFRDNSTDYTNALPGDAILELNPSGDSLPNNLFMENWNNDEADFFDGHSSWILRGGLSYHGDKAGIWHINWSYGNPDIYSSSRSVLSIVH